jgi:hypothetical protein
MSAYDRPFFNKMCVDNFMAGMIAFKKNQDQIYNIEIFQALYRIIDYYYLNKDKLDNICSVLINIDKPLYYGYEEVYLTTIIQYIINTFNLKVDTIPLYWDYGMTPVDSFIFTMSYGINSFLTDDFINFLSNILSINLELILNSIDIVSLYNLSNAPILIIITNILYNLYFDKIDSIIFNNKTIQIFKNKSRYQDTLAFFPFVSGYIIDLIEILFNDNFAKYNISITQIYDQNITYKIINIINLFQNKQYNDIKIIMDELYQSVNQKLSKNRYASIYLNYSRDNNSLLIDQNMIYPYSVLLYSGKINHHYLTSFNYTKLFQPLEINDLDIFKLNYNYIIPFGYYPQIAYALKRLHYIYNIYPFDEINYVTLDVLIDCLNNNFSKITDKQYYIDNEQVSSEHKSVTAGHSQVPYNKNMFIQFNPRREKDYNYFLQSIENLKTIINDNQLNNKVLYVHMDLFISHNKYNYGYVYTKFKILRKYIPNINFLFILIIYDTKQEISIIGEHKINNSILTIIEIHIESQSKGLIFEKPKDNLILYDILLKLKLTNIPNIFSNDIYLSTNNPINSFEKDIIDNYNDFKINGVYGKFITQNVINTLRDLNLTNNRSYEYIKKLLYYFTDPTFISLYYFMWDSISIIRHHECLFLGCTGNSLGYYRYKTHLPWDDDIDLYGAFENYNQLIEFMTSAINSDFIITFVLLDLTLTTKYKYKYIEATIEYITNQMVKDFKNKKIEFFTIKFKENILRQYIFKSGLYQYYNNTGQLILPWIDIFPAIKDSNTNIYQSPYWHDKKTWYITKYENNFTDVEFCGIKTKIFKNLDLKLLQTYFKTSDITQKNIIHDNLYIYNHLVGVKMHDTPILTPMKIYKTNFDNINDINVYNDIINFINIYSKYNDYTIKECVKIFKNFNNLI